MKRTILTFYVVMCHALLVCAIDAQTGARSASRIKKGRPLSVRLAAVLGKAEKLKVRCGAWVLRYGEDKPLYAYAADDAFIPASNMKVLTAILALETFGKKHEFVTEFRVNNAGVLSVSGTGDPCLNSACGSSREIFAKLAASLVDEQKVKIRGLFLDDRGWAGPSRPSGWPAGQLGHHYAAPTGPFVLEEGCLVARLDPSGMKSGPCRVSLVPSFLSLPHKGKIMLTGNRKRGGEYHVGEDGDGNLVLRGFFHNATPFRLVRVAANDPMRLFENALRGALKSRGMVCGPRIVAAPSASGDLVYAHRSALTKSVSRMLVSSSNFQAEQLVRLVALKKGKAASFEEGAGLLDARFRAFAAKKGSFVVADGSGLSRGNRVSPALLGKALQSAYRAPYNKALVQAFAQSGVSGTLLTRMKGLLRGNVRAKTGWIRGASGLTGYVRTANKKTLIFSILMNYDSRVANRKLKAIQDDFVTELFVHG